MEAITLTINDLEKLKVLERLKAKKIKQIDAAKLLGRSERQIRRLMKRYLEHGAKGLTSRLRGRPGNHRLPEKLKAEALHLIVKNYPDFGPTLAHEKLRNKHGIKMAVETVRSLMVEKHLWIAKEESPRPVHLRRERRASEGEMEQMDASHHDWFEGRGPKCALHVSIDDATSKIMVMRFALTESLEGYLELMRLYLTKYGRPLNVYVDRHGIFSVNKKDPLSEEKQRLTQFGRALQDLGINLIHAHSPQAKGRVERVNRTLQDRLVKELRLAGISDIDNANRFLEQFILQHNEQFVKPAASRTNLHRPLEPHHRLEKILTTHDYRVIQNDLTFSYGGCFYQVLEKHERHRLAKKRVLLWRDINHRLRAELDGKELEILPLSQVSTEQTNHIPLQSKVKKSWKPGRNHPYRRYKSRAA